MVPDESLVLSFNSGLCLNPDEMEREKDSEKDYMNSMGQQLKCSTAVKSLLTI